MKFSLPSPHHPACKIAIAIVAFFVINVVAFYGLNGWRIDLTADRMYTLSTGSRHIVSELNAPVRVRFYFSRKASNGYPAIKGLAERIHTLLDAYVRASDGKLSVSVIDPEPFSEAEDEAMALGLKGVELDGQGTRLYLGMVIQNAKDEKQILPIIQFEREKFLEYDISRMIYDLTHPSKTVVGIISSVPMMGAPAIPGLPIPGGSNWAIVEQMQHVFNVVAIPATSSSIPEQVTMLMVVNPTQISESLLYAIDQFVIKGGRAVFFIDPKSDLSNAPPQKSSDKTIDSLLVRWGISVTRDAVVGDRDAALEMNAEEGHSPFNNVTWLGLREENIDRADITVSDLHFITMITAGHINATDKNISLTPLLYSGTHTMEIPRSNFGQFVNTKGLLENFKDSGERYVLAARVAGKFHSSFEHAPQSVKNSSAFVAESANTNHIVVIADSDMLQDQYWTQSQSLMGYRLLMPTADNGGFVLNVLDHMSGSEDLIGLRGRGTAIRPFTVVEHLQRDAEEKFLATEKQIQAKLKETEKQLNALQASRANENNATLTPAQNAEVERFKTEMISLRRELRDVQSILRRDIETLGVIVKWFNMGLAPIAVVVFAVVYLRKRGRRR